MFCVYVFDLWGPLIGGSSTWKNNSQHLPDAPQVSHAGYLESTSLSWHPGLLSESHGVLYLDLTFLSWVEYSGYTRVRGGSKSAHMT